MVPQQVALGPRWGEGAGGGGPGEAGGDAGLGTELQAPWFLQKGGLCRPSAGYSWSMSACVYVGGIRVFDMVPLL